MTDPHPGPSWPDADHEFILSAFGRKGSGKTTINRLFYRQYPWARLCIDVNGEADPGPDAVRITSLSEQMPRPAQGEPYPNLHYIADPASPSYLDDLDRAIGMALYPQHERCLVWLGEIGEFGTANKCGPNLRRLLHQSRHYRMSVLIDGPRPMHIDPLILQQSDFIAIFPLPNHRDQERVANEAGLPVVDFQTACRDCWEQGRFHFLWFQREADSDGFNLFDMPPIKPPKETPKSYPV